MASKNEIQDVLGVRLTDEQLNKIEIYYKTFFENPKSYVNDGLVDIILDDLDIEKPRTIMGKLNMIEDLNLDHSDDKHTILWGTYRGKLAYAIPGGSSCSLRPNIYRNSEYPSNEPDTIPRIVVLKSVIEDKDEVYLIVDGSTVASAPPLDTFAIPGYKVSRIVPILSEGLIWEDFGFAVAFANVGNGVTPVLWPVCNKEILGNTPIYDFKWPAKTREGRVDKEYIKKLMNFIEDMLPSVDLDTQKDKRYAFFEFGAYTYGYNRNHIGHKGNVDSAAILLPFYTWYDVYGNTNNGKDNNLYQCYTGKESWDNLYFGKPVEELEETEPIEEVKQVEGPKTSSSKELDTMGNSMLDTVKFMSGNITKED